MSNLKIGDCVESPGTNHDYVTGTVFHLGLYDNEMRAYVSLNIKDSHDDAGFYLNESFANDHGIPDCYLAKKITWARESWWVKTECKAGSTKKCCDSSCKPKRKTGPGFEWL
jgi:hypothetical protein